MAPPARLIWASSVPSSFWEKPQVLGFRHKAAASASGPNQLHRVVGGSGAAARFAVAEAVRLLAWSVRQSANVGIRAPVIAHGSGALTTVGATAAVATARPWAVIPSPKPAMPRQTTQATTTSFPVDL
jgi:hypothetical protein